MYPGLLTDLATDVIKLIGSLSPIPPVDDVGLRQRFLDLLSEFHARGVRAGYPSDLVDAARIALMVLIDERVTGLDAAIATAWKNAPLLQQLSTVQDADNGFMDRLSALRPPATAAHADALEVFHLCLSFGLRGRFTIDEEPARQRLITELTHEIRTARGAVNAPKSPIRAASPTALNIPHPYRWHGLPVWAIPLTLGVLVLLWWLITSSWTLAEITRLATDFQVP